MLDPFDQKKASILSEIGATDAANPDALPKGTIDEGCRALMGVINADRDMVTTSSCSGRVSVFLEGIKEGAQIGAKGHDGRWIFVTHTKAELAGWFDRVPLQFVADAAAVAAAAADGARARYILYKFEPLILHVKCRLAHSANRLYTAAMGCGFRESGIGTNHVVAIRTSIRLDVPIGQMDATGQLVAFVGREYLRVVTRLSEDRFDENERKIKALEVAIAHMLALVGGETETREAETREARQQRKRREGLARQEAMRAQREIRQ